MEGDVSCHDVDDWIEPVEGGGYEHKCFIPQISSLQMYQLMLKNQWKLV